MKDIVKYTCLLLALIVHSVFISDVAKSAGIDCKRHRAYCAIVKLKPKINKHFAMQLSNHIYHASRKYNVDMYRVIAIMRQESGIRMNARNYSEAQEKTRVCDKWEKCTTVIVKIKETTDFGLFQFHIDTMKHNKLNIKRVMTDMPFTVNFAVKYLANKIKMCSRTWPKTSWACYNSGNSGPHKQYVKDVNRYYLGKEDKGATTQQNH